MQILEPHPILTRSESWELVNLHVEQAFKINISRLLNGYGVSLVGVENFLESGGGDGFTTW